MLEYFELDSYYYAFTNRLKIHADAYGDHSQSIRKVSFTIWDADIPPGLILLLASKIHFACEST